MAWKQITVPKAVYLPTGSPDGAFKDTGCRVEPSDKIEIQDGTGSRLIRINGVEHNLLRPTDTLRLDANNCLILDKPQPFVLSASGEGSAFVGRTGEAVRAARGRWDHDTAQRWEGDESSHVGKEWLTAQIQRAANQGAFDDVDLGEGEESFITTEDQAAIDEFFTDFEAAQRKATEHTEVRSVTLKDGSQGFALFDKRTGMQIGATTRQYKPVYDSDGQQSGASLGYQGPKSTFNLEEHRRRLQAQAKDARVVAGPGTPTPVPLPPPAPAPALQPKPSRSFTTTGHRDLDGLLGSAIGTPGLPLGSITYLAVEGGGASHLLRGEQNAICPSIEAAFAKVHLLPANQRPLILITLSEPPEGPSDQLRLLLAEQLPVLSHMVRELNKVAVVITSPLWPEDRTPALLASFGIPDFYLRVAAHARDPRFLTATLIKGGQGSVTFPRG